MHRDHTGVTARIARWASRVVLALLVVVTVAGGIAAPLARIDLSAVLSGSMRPTYMPGDLVLSARWLVTDLRPGQVALVTPTGERTSRAHRVVAIEQRDRGVALVTKGDANAQEDSEHVVIVAADVPVVFATVPGAGYLLLWLQNPPVRAGLIALVGLLIIATGARFLLQTAPSPAMSRDHSTFHLYTSHQNKG